MGARRTSDERADAAAEASNARFTIAHRRVGKTLFAALALFAVGSVMIFFGVGALREDFDRGVAMTTVGVIAFLPGFYATATLYGAWREWPGYSFESLPSYDEN